ncbi:ketosynthase chain-length factor [Amycolatopsis sp. WAC 04197]|uniref:ketosynthase chain-length factor n=1 Tax=Amycolatopsis sp. WAC 04197 TaxID=2203199 RepID=UPI000F7995FC|nr:ketosynthase chain-length factor [Amycolatopsis sp. WAC 04197]RSN39088.1 ketosynthase chain-length factor [Amycolatopsis sp. WAC 04197]
MSTRTAVTGMSAATALGLGTEEYWKAVLAGQNGLRELSRFDTAGHPAKLAGEITEFRGADHLPGRLLPQTDISTQIALAVADWAIEDAALDPEKVRDYDMGVVTSNALGGFEFTHREFNKLWSQGPQSVSVYESFAWFYAVNTGQISIRHKMRGPGAALVGEQAGGLDAIGHARRTIRRGTPLVLTGGVDSALDPWGWASQQAGGQVSVESDPRYAYLPFDERAAGYVPGEGGAILVLEELTAAMRRGAPRLHGEIAGYAATFDPKPGSGRPPGLKQAAELAIADAGLTPDAIDLVFADAAGLPELDRAEAGALNELFGRRKVPVAAPKAAFGRLYSGGGPVDVLTALLSIRDDVVPPVAIPEPSRHFHGLDLVVGEPRSADVDTVLIQARGRWGFNSALVIRALRA